MSPEASGDAAGAGGVGPPPLPEGAAGRRPRRLAALDVGSNTVHLLVADWDGRRLRRVWHRVTLPRPGAAVEATGRLGPAVLAQVEADVRAAAAAARRRGAEVLLVAATEPVRRASDREAALAAIAAAAGVECRLLSPEAEARLAFRGAVAHRRLDGPLVVADVGGGSTEVVIGDDARPLVVASLPVGSGVATQRWLASDPPRPEERAACAAGVAEILAAAPPGRPRVGIVTGGTATTLRRLLGRPRSRRLSWDDLERCRRLLDGAPSATVAATTGLDCVRVRLLAGGVEVVAAVVARYGLAEIEVSTAGLREGMLLAWLERHDSWAAG